MPPSNAHRRYTGGTTHENSDFGSEKSKVDVPIVVVFGRPGAGKTSVADEALRLVEDDCKDMNVRGLDLDVCVPQWMRDNFGAGIYPTLDERKDFALSCCDYVESNIPRVTTKIGSQNTVTDAFIISFSFVNTDLRDIFRARFPDAVWVLVDTNESVAEERIKRRVGHFYNGAPPVEGDLSSIKQGDTDSQDIKSSSDKAGGTKFSVEDTDVEREKNDQYEENSEWNFAPVTFPHTILDGVAPVSINANIIVHTLNSLLTKRTVKE